MPRRSLRHVPLALASLVAACSSTPTPSSSRLEVAVASLTLPGVQDVCYSLAIRNEANQTVSSRSDICASKFGASGGITYVATCDATDTDGNGTATNSVTLTIDGLYGGPDKTAPLTDYIDPCAAPHAPNGCQLTANCVENGDTAVTFNLTLMRQANQGFFDIAVNFDDIFCAAKLDCTDSASVPLRLLHNPTTGLRDQTAVVALACTTGPGGADTHLLRDPIKVTCDSGTTYLDPTATKGNAYGSGFGQVADPNPADPIWQYAIYAGSENLMCGGLACDKRYWNIAVGFDPTAKNCRLTTAASAIDASVTSTFSTPANTNYPLIAWDVALTSNTTPTTLACSKHPLNGTPTGVGTTYTGVGKDKTFVGLFTGTSLEVGPCPTGYSGRTCSTPVCSPTCGARGTCTAPNTCTCETGYGGATCDTPVCTGGCGANASCTGPETCTCNSGYFLSGGLCQLPTCTGGCANGGTCTAPNTCACATGWTGANCQNPICTSACQNGGTCSAPDTCSCPSGWTGPTCESATSATVVTSDRIFALDAGDAASYPGSGTAWTSLVGTNHATTTGGPSFNSLNYGYLSFDGVDDYALSNANLQTLGMNSVTVEAWINLSTAVPSGQLEVFNALGMGLGNYSGWWVGIDSRFSSNALGFAFVDANSSYRRVHTAGFAFAPDVWYHVVVILDRSTSSYRAYVNGAEKALTTNDSAGAGFPTAGLTSSVKLNIATYDSERSTSISGNAFPGRLATTSIYSRALSATEVRQNYDALKSRFYTTQAPAITSSGLALNLDAGEEASYPGHGTAWQNRVNPENATLSGGVGYSHLNAGQLRFDGVNDYASVSKTRTSFGAGDFSIEFWLKSDAVLNDKVILTGRGGGNNASMQLATGGASGSTAGVLRILTANDTAITSTAIVADMNWRHVVVTRAAGTLKIWINAKLDTTVADPSTESNTASPWVIGSHDNLSSKFFVGAIPVVRMYTRALSEGEIVQNYEATADRYHTVLDLDFGDKRTLFPTGTNVARSMVGNGVSGSLNATSYTASRGGGLSFNGSAYVGIPHTLLNGTGDFTATFWVETSGGYGTVFGNYPAGNLQVFHNSNFIGVWLNNNSAYMGVSPWNTMLPQFSPAPTALTVLRRGTTTEVYLNGVLQKTGSSSATFGNVANFRIGQNTASGETYIGKIYTAKVLNRAWSASEIMSYVGATRGRFVNATDSDATAFLVAAGITDVTTQGAIDALVLAMKSAGIWTKMKAIYPMVGGTPYSHRFNLKDPRDLDAAFRLSFAGTWTHSATGARPSGSGSYANTYLKPSVVFDDTTFEAFGYYSRTATEWTRDYVLGSYDGVGGIGMVAYRISDGERYNAGASHPNTAYTHVNSNLTSNGLGFLLFSHQGSDVRYWKSNILRSYSRFTANANRSTRDIYLGAINNQGNAADFSNKECAFAFFSTSLTDAEASALYSAVQTFNTALGREVSP